MRDLKAQNPSVTTKGRANLSRKDKLTLQITGKVGPTLSNKTVKKQKLYYNKFLLFQVSSISQSMNGRHSGFCGFCGALTAVAAAGDGVTVGGTVATVGASGAA